MSDDQLPDLEIDFSSHKPEDDDELSEVGYSLSQDERVVRVFFPNVGGGSEPEDEAEEDELPTPPYGIPQHELPEETPESPVADPVDTQDDPDQNVEQTPALSPIRLPPAPRDRPPTDEFLPRFEDTGEFKPVPDDENAEGVPTPEPRSLSELVSDLAVDDAEAVLNVEPALEGDSEVEHKNLRPIDDILFMLEAESESPPVDASAAKTRPAMRTPVEDTEPDEDTPAGQEIDRESVPDSDKPEEIVEVVELTAPAETDLAFDLPAFEPVANLQYEEDVEYEEELEKESHRRRQKNRRTKRRDRRINVGILALLIIGVILLVGGGALLWMLFQDQADAFLADLLQREVAVEVSPTAEGALLEPTAAITPTEVRPTVTPFPTTTSVPEDGAASATEEATEPASEPAPAATQAPVTIVPEIISNSEGILLNGAQMNYVAGGAFSMGDGVATLAHTVTLSPYYIDKYEVTNARWEACVDAGVCSEPFSTQSYDGSAYYGNKDYVDYPVIFVDWHGANAYCQWLGARLPTEAEWEMAARFDPQAETVSIYPWGDAWEPAANICDTNCPLPGRLTDYDDGYAPTAPVGSYENGASPTGVLDMAGNVGEWVGDWYSSGYYATSSEEDPPGPASGTLKVVRGGAWGVNTQGVLSAARSRFAPGTSGPGLGFRCAIPASAVNP